MRSAFMRALTKGMGTKPVGSPGVVIDNSNVQRILVCRPNHRLGNLLLITPVIHAMVETFPEAKIDLFTKGGLGSIIFKNHKSINQIIQLPKKPFKSLWSYINGWLAIRRNNYDLVINVIRESSSGRIAARISKAKYKFFGDGDMDTLQKYGDHKHIAKYPIYNLHNYLSAVGITNISMPVTPLDLKLSPDELAAGKKILDDLVDNSRRTICIYTFATGNKCYSKDWWSPFYERLKTEYSGYNILEILPVENVSQIDFKATSFYSKDIREIAAVIANTEVFIGADSGIMHLASAAHAPTVGFFSVTDHAIYGPYNEHSVSLNTTTTRMDDWISAINKILSRSRN